MISRLGLISLCCAATAFALTAMTAPGLARPREPDLVQTLLPPNGSPADLVTGNDKATVTIIEYGSMVCDVCARDATKFFPTIKQKYIDTGRVRFIFRGIPVQPVELDLAAFMLAHCTAGNKAIELMEALYRRRSEWIVARPAEPLRTIVASFGIGEQEFGRCLQNQDLVDQIQATAETYMKKVSKDDGRVPSYFVVGQHELGEYFLSDDVLSNLDQYFQ